VPDRLAERIDQRKLVSPFGAISNVMSVLVNLMHEMISNVTT